MGLIIKDNIQKMIKGFPTVSDKYNVAGAMLTGSNAVKFGDLVQFSSTTGYYEKAVSVSAIGDIAGVVLGTNVKLAEGFPGTEPEVKVGEAFNLLLNGYVAVELDSGATAAQIAANKGMCVILSTGKITTIDKASAGTIVQLPDYVFTGEKELVGSNYIAEVFVK